MSDDAPPVPSTAKRDLLLLAAVFVGLFLVSVQVDAFEAAFELSRRHERWQLDEVLAAVLLASVALAVFSFRRWREFRDTFKELRILRGLLPICAWCKRVRNDDGEWQGIESYVAQHTQAVFSHGICEECQRKMG